VIAADPLPSLYQGIGNHHYAIAKDGRVPMVDRIRHSLSAIAAYVAARDWIFESEARKHRQRLIARHLRERGGAL
jgi:hypothetical protein